VFALVDLWLACRLRGGHHLPFAGGVGDQEGAAMDGFALLDHWLEEGRE
jgi:hypothetical protein